LLYQLCDLTLSTTTPLPELPRVVRENGGTPVRLEFGLYRAHRPRVEPFHKWLDDDGHVWAEFFRHGPDYLVRFTGMADFVVSRTAERIGCRPRPGIARATVRHLLLDQVLPLAQSVWGKLVLHASAVLSPWGAIAFLGTSGEGKSTLALALAREGLPLVTDDYLIVDDAGPSLVAVPAYPGVRLWPDTVSALGGDRPRLSKVAHYTEKVRMGDARDLSFCSAAAPLRRVFALAEPDGGAAGAVHIESLPESGAFEELMKSAFVLDPMDAPRTAELFGRVARAARSKLVYKLSFPRDFSALPAVCEKLFRHLREKG
jgi:hypothetical protein